MLGDYINFTKGFAFKSDSFVKNGIKIVKVGNLNSDMSESSDWYFIDESEFDKYRKYQIKSDDVIVSTVGSWENNPNSKVGKACMFFNVEEKLLLNQNAVIIRTNDDNVLRQKYLKYLIFNNAFGDYIIGCAQGSANQASITLNDIGNYKVNIPDVATQDKVIKILDGIMLKIISNKEINNSLKEIGKILYQKFLTTDLDEFELKRLDEVTVNNRNKIDSSKEYRVLSAINTGKLVLSDELFNKRVYSKDISKYLNVNFGDFAYNPSRINIGSIGINEYSFNCCVSPIYVTFSVDEEYRDFFELFFKSKQFAKEVNLRASGTVRQSLNYGDFGLIEIKYPSKKAIKKFNSMYSMLKDKIINNCDITKNLIELRDTILPKLMNGEIDLNNIEI